MNVAAAPSVRVKDLSVCFGAFRAVDRISFEVKKGEIFGFLGANGAGKTTTIRVLCGLMVPTGGEVEVAGCSLRDSRETVKARVGYMSQKFTLYEDLTVEENLMFAGSLRKIESRRLAERSAEILDWIAFNKPLSTLVRDLPGGIKQQVSLACAILHDPEIIFLDEPTAGVTPAARSRFWALIRRLSEQGKTVFVTTHYMDEAEQCSRIALMREGRMVALDSPVLLKKTAFPEGIIEVVPRVNVTPDEIDDLRRMHGVLSLQPYGSRYHLMVEHPGRWLSGLGEETKRQLELRAIPPSLEDVFIRLVEEEKR